MLQRFENTRPYAQPLSPIEAKGKRYALPPDFVSGLTFLRPLLSAKGQWLDTQVHLLNGKLYALTNKLIVEHVLGDLELRNWWFNSKTIRTLEAFQAPPSEVFVDGVEMCFRWCDGQAYHVRPMHDLLPGDGYQRAADDAFNRFWCFDQGIELIDETRRYIRKLINDKKLAPDIFIDGQAIASRASSNGKNWTLESSDPFPTNATRIMRFDRKAFLDMIRVADEIDFTASPVCFRHAHGRGLLIERTATSDTPDFGAFDD